MNLPAIFPHANLDALLNALLGALEKMRRRGVGAAAWRRIPVVVPSIQFTDWLQVAITRRTGLCMGFDFIMPQGFVDRALAIADGVERNRENPWSNRNLTWLLLPHVKDYAAQLGLKEPSSRDRLALAGLLADQFDQYVHFRPEMIEAWNSGKSAARKGWSKTDKENEAWQRELWNKVRTAIEKRGQSKRHPSLLPNELANDDAFLHSLQAAFPQLFVVGTGALDPLLVRVLKLLERAGCDVQAHMTLPSLGYLGEMRKSPLKSEQDPEAIEMREGHPLLLSMGRHAVGSFLLLGELDENYTHWPDGSEPPESSPSVSLLRRIQADIRELKAPDQSYLQAEDDISIRVHSCFGPRREMEVLHDELLRAFSDLKDLKPEEVVVVTPTLETYAPLVAAVLEQAPPLPVRLTELPPSEQDPMAEGLLALLEMARSRCEASGLLELLHLRAVRASLGAADDFASLDRLRQWIDASGLTCGLDEEPGPCPISTGSWRFARDRMIAGTWFGDESTARYPNGDYVLPVADDLEGNSVLRAAFIQWLWKLARTLREWSIEATPSAWSERFADACSNLLSNGEDDDSTLEIQYALSFLSQLECQELLDAGAIGDWLRAASAESPRRTPVSGRITFGRFKQLQNIPCRVLAMVGMQDGACPRQNRISAWDLLHCAPKAWDRNARLDDRQLFLDAVLTPADRLIITASTRNVRSGKREPFSSCVDELLRVAQATVSAERKLVIEHRLQPFAAGYFGGTGNSQSLPRSFDASSAKVAESFLKTSTAARKGLPFWNPDALIEKTKLDQALPLTIDQLVNFWKDPAKAFLRAQGITLSFEEGDDEALNRSPLVVENLEKWQARNAVMQAIIEERSSLDYVKARLSADRGLPLSVLGNLQWEALYSKTEPLGRKVREIKTDDLPLDLMVAGTSNPARLTGRLLCGKLDDTAVLLAYRLGEFKDARHYLHPWIQAIAAACAGHSLRSYLLDDERLEEPECLQAYPLDRAEETLRHLIAGYVEGQLHPLCYAPAASDAYVEACQQWTNAPNSSALEAASEAWNAEPFNGPAGDGFSESAKVAWRDHDPFSHSANWHRWAHAIARPLHAWFQSP